MLLSLYIKITSNLKHRAEKKKKTQKTHEEETIFFRNKKYKIQTYLNSLSAKSNDHADNA